MADLVIVAVILAFFALCVAYVVWCDRMIGPDPAAASGVLVDRTEADEVPA